MDVRPIRTRADHAAALREIDVLWGAAEGTDEGDRLDILLALVESYEAKTWPEPAEADPIAVSAGSWPRTTPLRPRPARPGARRGDGGGVETSQRREGDS